MAIWLDFIGKVISALAWPVAVVIIGLMFKDRLEHLLTKVKHAKGAGFEFDFSEQVSEVAIEAKRVEAKVESLGNVVKFGTLTVQQPPAEDVAPPLQTHYDSPRWRIMDAYSSVESAMEKIIRLGGLQKRTDGDGPSIYSYTLMTEGIIDNSTRLLIEKLRELRDKAVTSEVEPKRADADTFYVAARSVHRALSMKLHEQVLNKEEAMRSAG